MKDDARILTVFLTASEAISLAPKPEARGLFAASGPRGRDEGCDGQHCRRGDRGLSTTLIGTPWEESGAVGSKG